MEDINDQLYVNKYTILSKKSDNRKLGEQQSFCTKFLTGFTLVLVLILVIWFPLLLMSLLNTQGVSNTPTEVTLSVSIDVYEPLFSMDLLIRDAYVTRAEYDLLAGMDTSGYVANFQNTVACCVVCMYACNTVHLYISLLPCSLSLFFLFLSLSSSVSLSLSFTLVLFLSGLCTYLVSLVVLYSFASFRDCQGCSLHFKCCI